MKNRIWIIPAIILVLIGAAWTLRWDAIKVTSDATYYADRWTGQSWVKGVDKYGPYNHPAIPDTEFEQQAWVLIKQDTAKAAKLESMDNAITNLPIVMKENARDHSEYESLCRQYLREYHKSINSNPPFLFYGLDSLSEDERRYILIRMPADVKTAAMEYESAEANLKGFEKEKAELFQSAKNLARQTAYIEAKNLRMATGFFSMVIFLLMLIWLILIYVKGGSQASIKKDMQP